MKKLFILQRRGYVLQKGYFFSLLLVAVSLFSPALKFTNLAIILLALVWLLEGGFIEKYKRLTSNPVALSFIVLFLLYLIGVFYTDSLHEGVKSLETKAPLLIFPLLLGSASISKAHIHKVLLFFALACVLCSLVALIYQTYVVLEKNDFNYFFSDGLVAIMHKKAVFYALYVAFSILILVDYLWANFPAITFSKKLLAAFSVFFLLLFLFLLATRTTLGALLLILVTTFTVAGIRYGKLKYTALLLGVLFIFLATLSILFPQTISRFKSLHNVSYSFSNTEEVYHFSGADSDTNWNGLNLRLAKWVCAVDVIKEHPLTGVGTGDVKNEMVASYKKRNFVYAAERRFDPHNQYLDTAVGIGLPGLIILLICYFSSLHIAVKRRSWLLSMFMILIMFCSLTDSILDSAQGIIFFCFFLFLLLQSTSIRGVCNNSKF